MKMTALTALSPLDGRYHHKTAALRPFLSEYGLIRYRVIVEVRWLIALTQEKALKEIPRISKAQCQKLDKLISDFDETAAEAIKNIEATTNHDVKAVEYYLQHQLENDPELNALIPFIHFGCTSEDINNLAYALMLRDARDQVMLPALREIGQRLTHMAVNYSDLALLARTHGQAASPTTLGKELANIAARINTQFHTLKNQQLLGKINGAVGNFNAHHVAYPHFDWPKFSRHFITSLQLAPNEYTTQIEPHDNVAELLQTLARMNTILIDCCRDMWSYISLGYFHQQSVKNEVGSSTMPHKVNPIDFENAEGNLGLANAMANHMASKLPISRWQRDLTDSTVMRNLATAFAYSLVAYQALLTGLNKVSANQPLITNDLAQHWEVLAEAIQTVMRRHGMSDAYEQLKDFTRGKAIDERGIKAFIAQLSLPEAVKKPLTELTPNNYIGLATTLARKAEDMAWD